MDIDNIGNGIHNTLNNQSSDYSVESIASSLIKKGVLPEHIIFKSKGTSRRSYKKDVSDFYITLNEETNSNLFFLESPREGIYDTLPESIFHSFSGTKSLTNKESIKDEIKKHREEEKQARLFFLPFEQEFFNIKRTLFTFEDAFDSLENASSLIEIYKSYYPVLADLSVEKGYLFLRLTPLIHDIRDDFTRIEECLSMLLDADVRISISYQKNVITSYTPPELGFATLGTNTIIGNVIEDGEPDLRIELSPVKLEAQANVCASGIHSEEHDYLFFQKQIKLTKQLCDFLIGAQYEVSVSYALDGVGKDLLLNNTAVLGYSVCL
jgi:hypothetical protein